MFKPFGTGTSPKMIHIPTPPLQEEGGTDLTRREWLLLYCGCFWRIPLLPFSWYPLYSTLSSVVVHLGSLWYWINLYIGFSHILPESRILWFQHVLWDIDGVNQPFLSLIWFGLQSLGNPHLSQLHHTSITKRQKSRTSWGWAGPSSADNWVLVVLWLTFVSLYWLIWND